MRENKHIEKELLFKTNIKDITSISLDRDYKVEDNSIVGNFIINGEYKVHEVSLNREKFDFKIPFSHEIDNDIESSSVDIEITDFTYDYQKDELVVNIDYELTGNRKDILEFSDEESLDEFLQNREVDVIDTRIDEIKNNIDNEANVITEEKNDIRIEQIPEDTNEEVEANTEIIKEENLVREDIEPKNIINNIVNKEDGFVTYKVYTLKENETLESIVIKYHTTIDDIKEYNDLNNLSIGDKIIIPKYE